MISIKIKQFLVFFFENEAHYKVFFTLGDLEGEKHQIVVDVKQFTESNESIKEEIISLREKYNELKTYAAQNGITLPEMFQSFVDCSDLLN